MRVVIEIGEWGEWWLCDWIVHLVTVRLSIRVQIVSIEVGRLEAID